MLLTAKRVALSYMIAGRSQTFTGSFATVARQILVPRLDGVSWDSPPRLTPRSNRLVADLTLAIFAAYYLLQAYRLYRQPDPRELPRLWTRLLLVFLIVATVWFQEWYAIWVVAMAAILEENRLMRTALLFSGLVTLQPFIYNFLTLRPNHWAPLPWRDLLPVLAVMGGAGAYLILSKGWRLWVIVNSKQ